VDRPCWGMPQQGLLMPSPSEFPDFRLQYPKSFDLLVVLARWSSGA